MRTAYVRTVYWSVRMVISSPICTVFTLKFSDTHAFVNRVYPEKKTSRQGIDKDTKIAQVRFSNMV